ncbi:unnamed protein product [Dicrocoelium dendriticum]|nr:unnamed protein product [Dicrocoelium dendriticum]
MLLVGGIVEPEKNTRPINPLTETELFSRVQRNDYIEAHPSEIHFPFVNIRSEKKPKMLKLINVGTSTTRIHIIPPQTSFFKCSYKTPEKFVPGSSIICWVHFIPADGQCYKDVIRIHTEHTDRHLVVPVYAYPVAGRLNFPGNIRIPAVPLGTTKRCKIPLSSFASTDFEYTIKKVQDHPCYDVQPLAG